MVLKVIPFLVLACPGWVSKHNGSNIFSTFANYFNRHMRIFQFILMLVLTIAVVTGCNSGGKKDQNLPADIVNNPKSADGNESKKGVPRIAFKNTEHDFGRVIEGEKITYAFKFTNSGSGNLVITNVSSSCGCTVPEFTKDPVKPGENGNIKVTFDSKNRRGFQNKTVTVVTNTQPNTKVLRIKAQVIEPENF